MRKLTKEEFIEKANKKHGEGTYDYSKSEYKNSYTKIFIICHKHDKPFEFSQTPAHHLQGRGCPLCAIENRAKNNMSTTEEFIEKANIKYGEGTYDYSKVNYIKHDINVIIICHKHDKPYEFHQTPHNHLIGRGCPLCAKKHKLSTEEFIEKANKIHGIGTYNYSKVNYINAHTNVIIICPKHGEFLQTPTSHLCGQGCSKCSGNKKSNTEEFIEKANKKHGIGTYDYSKVNYINSNTCVTIICPKHGDFSQTPRKHLRGQGCPKCNKNKGEDIIRKFLIKNGIGFEEQKSFKGCEYKKLLKFDFYVPQYNLCIESDGSPHFKNINWNGKYTNKEMEENLKLNQLRDKIKNDYCKKNRINLLRLSNLKTFEEKLENYFQKYISSLKININYMEE